MPEGATEAKFGLGNLVEDVTQGAIPARAKAITDKGIRRGNEDTDSASILNRQMIIIDRGKFKGQYTHINWVEKDSNMLNVYIANHGVQLIDPRDVTVV